MNEENKKGKEEKMSQNIDMLLSFSRELLAIDVRSLPGTKVILRLKEYFKKYDLPLEGAALTQVSVCEEFFEDEEVANEILDNIANFYKKSYDFYVEEFGQVQGKSLFLENCKKFSITYDV